MMEVVVQVLIRLPLNKGASDLALHKESFSYIASLDRDVIYAVYCLIKKCCLLFRKKMLRYLPAIIVGLDSTKFTNL